MKKIYLAGCLLLSSFALFAADGDTTNVISHTDVQLTAHGDYDGIAAFPDGSVNYRKITMEFELGKYACPGYNPNNPGEDSTQTGWCGDWDYDVHILACTPGGDTIELGRIITPYANSNMPRTPLSWKHPYLFDVTDYYPLLKDDVTIRVSFEGWSAGFTASVKFHFIEGTPARNVVKIDPLWRGTYYYGKASDPIETSVADITLNTPLTANFAEMKMFITGHGGDNNENCAEFCKKWYKFKVDGNVVDQRDIWRDDCGSNFLYPQSGTWVYDRGNWCPGDLVRTNIHKVPASLTASPTFTVGLDFQPYTSPDSQAVYKIGAAMFYYGAFNHSLDAGIEEIISPNMDETYYRSNPICGEPKITVKNYGSDPITSIKFQYGIEGQTLNNYTWTNNLSSLNTAEVTLPSIADLSTASGTNNFVVKIIEVNGSTDQESLNNTLVSKFTSAPKWTGGNFYVDFKMSDKVYMEDNMYHINEVNWNVSDMDGNVIFNRSGNVNNSRYIDTFSLPNGCYKLNVDASTLGVGLNFFNSFIKGYFRIYDLTTGNKIALPKTDLGASSLAGNFGNGFTQYFTVTNSTASIEDLGKQNYTLIIYPNPAKDFIQIDVVGELSKESIITISNIIGQEVYSTTTKSKKISIPVSSLANGIYTLNFQNEGNRKVEKIVISK